MISWGVTTYPPLTPGKTSESLKYLIKSRFHDKLSINIRISHSCMYICICTSKISYASSSLHHTSLSINIFSAPARTYDNNYRFAGRRTLLRPPYTPPKLRADIDVFFTPYYSSTVRYFTPYVHTYYIVGATYIVI